LRNHIEKKSSSYTFQGKGLFIIVLFICLLHSSELFSQRQHKLRSPNLIVGGRYYYGWTLAHHIEMDPFQQHYPAYEISLIKATYGKNLWSQMYGFPWIGISYWYSDLGKTEWLGEAHAVYPFINFPLVYNQKLSFNFRMGVGLAYLTKRYHKTDNYKNLSIGSHINGAVNLLFELRWEPVRKLNLSAGISLVHFSNGTTKTPNYGVNMMGANVGITYRLSRENPYLTKKHQYKLYPFEFDDKRIIFFDVTVAGAIKDMQSVLGVGNQYYVLTVFGNVLKPVGFKTKLGLGFDLSYDGSDIKMLELRGEEPESFYKVMRKGINGAFELSFSKASMFFNVGVYIGGQDKSDGDVYEKFSLRYDITDNLFASLILKAHFARADFLAVGIGYKFLKYYYLGKKRKK